MAKATAAFPANDICKDNCSNIIFTKSWGRYPVQNLNRAAFRLSTCLCIPLQAWSKASHWKKIKQQKKSKQEPRSMATGIGRECVIDCFCVRPLLCLMAAPFELEGSVDSFLWLWRIKDRLLKARRKNRWHEWFEISWNISFWSGGQVALARSTDAWLHTEKQSIDRLQLSSYSLAFCAKRTKNIRTFEHSSLMNCGDTSWSKQEIDEWTRMDYDTIWWYSHFCSSPLVALFLAIFQLRLSLLLPHLQTRAEERGFLEARVP